LIEQHVLPALYQGEVALAVGWFDRLPETLLQSAPMLCIDKAWALALMQHGARREEAERALHAADQALDRVNAGQALRDLVAGHTASIRPFLMQRPALVGEEPERLIALAREALRLLPAQEKAIRSVNALNLGYGYLALADLEAANRGFRQALEDGLSGGNLYAAIYGPVNLILNALLVGHLREALQLCDTNIERFNQILAGKNFPSVGVLGTLKGCILLEMDRLADAESALTEGLDLIRWAGEGVAHRKGYTALARLRAIQGNRPGMLEAVKTMEETWPEGALYSQAVRHRLSMRHWSDDPDVRKDAGTWLAGSGIEFDVLPVMGSVYPLHIAHFESCLNAAHVLAHLAKGEPGAYPLEGVQACLNRQQDFAVSHGLVSQQVEVAIARTLLYQAAGRKDEALDTLGMALAAAAPTGLLRIFLDEGRPLQALLEQLKPRLAEKALIAYANHLLDALSSKPAIPETADGSQERLSERELEVLHYLAGGLSYEEIGRQLFLSLNTIQSHVKNIYRKLLVNKRVQAIEKARAMNLI
ncbi:MAG: LuxR C-terminal-related transcriptional regulator, partial [Bacteroidota bacterium]